MIGVYYKNSKEVTFKKIISCLFQSYRYFPSNISVIEWLGAYYIDTQFCEKAIQYFERATLIQ